MLHHQMAQARECMGPHSMHPCQQVRADLSPEARRKVNTLVITDVHGRDIVDAFVRDSIVDAGEFAWESQLRYYWERAQVGGCQALHVCQAPAARLHLQRAGLRNVLLVCSMNLCITLQMPQPQACPQHCQLATSPAPRTT